MEATFRTKVEPVCCDGQQAWATKITVGNPRKGDDGLIYRRVITIGWQCAACDHKELFPWISKVKEEKLQPH